MSDGDLHHFELDYHCDTSAVANLAGAWSDVASMTAQELAAVRTHLGNVDSRITATSAELHAAKSDLAASVAEAKAAGVAAAEGAAKGAQEALGAATADLTGQVTRAVAAAHDELEAAKASVKADFDAALQTGIRGVEEKLAQSAASLEASKQELRALVDQSVAGLDTRFNEITKALTDSVNAAKSEMAAAVEAAKAEAKAAAEEQLAAAKAELRGHVDASLGGLDGKIAALGTEVANGAAEAKAAGAAAAEAKAAAEEAKGAAVSEASGAAQRAREYTDQREVEIQKMLSAIKLDELVRWAREDAVSTAKAHTEEAARALQEQLNAVTARVGGLEGARAQEQPQAEADEADLTLAVFAEEAGPACDLSDDPLPAELVAAEEEFELLAF
eukprot:tig00001623_g9417.t1